MINKRTIARVTIALRADQANRYIPLYSLHYRKLSKYQQRTKKSLRIMNYNHSIREINLCQVFRIFRIFLSIQYRNIYLSPFLQSQISSETQLTSAYIAAKSVNHPLISIDSQIQQSKRRLSGFTAKNSMIQPYKIQITLLQLIISMLIIILKSIFLISL